MLKWHKTERKALAKGYSVTVYKPPEPVLSVAIELRRYKSGSFSVEEYAVIYNGKQHGEIWRTLVQAKKCAEALIKERGETDGKAYSG